MPLGKLVVATPGTAIQFTSVLDSQTNLNTGTNNKSYGNLMAAVNGGGPDNGNDAWARRIDIKANPSNKGRVYIGRVPAQYTAGTSSVSASLTLDKTNFTNVIWYLDPGESYTIDNPQQAQPYHVGEYWVDADNAGDWIAADFDNS